MPRKHDDAVDPELEAAVRRLVTDLVADDAPEQQLEQLRAIRAVRGALDRLEGEAMYRHLAGDGQFADLGAALGISSQAASWRFRRHHQLHDPRGEGRAPRRGRGPYRRRNTGGTATT